MKPREQINSWIYWCNGKIFFYSVLGGPYLIADYLISGTETATIKIVVEDDKEG